jgi:hypothetical protein
VIGTENKTGHLSNVHSHRKQSFRMVEIRDFEVPLSAISGHLESPRTSPSLPRQSGRGESGQKRSEPANIGTLIPEECIVMGAVNLQ